MSHRVLPPNLDAIPYKHFLSQLTPNFTREGTMVGRTASEMKDGEIVRREC